MSIKSTIKHVMGEKFTKNWETTNSFLQALGIGRHFVENTNDFDERTIGEVVYLSDQFREELHGKRKPQGSSGPVVL